MDVKRTDRSGWNRGWMLVPLIAIGAVLVLLAMGRPALCPCGTVKLWHGLVQSDENSQQISDWYSLSHIVHGLIFYGAAHALLGRRPLWARAAAATLVEAGWEILENSPIIIDRYRTATIALGYSGDSVLNSASDIAMMLIGFAIAARLPWRWTVTFGLALELTALFAIRDNLTLNVLMLLWPIDAVKVWQGGG